LWAACKEAAGVVARMRLWEKKLLDRKGKVVEFADQKTQRTVCPGEEPARQAAPAQQCEPSNWAVLDRALILLLDHEESILGNIVAECNALVHLAEEQAVELAEYLEEQS